MGFRHAEKAGDTSLYPVFAVERQVGRFSVRFGGHERLQCGVVRRNPHGVCPCVVHVHLPTVSPHRLQSGYGGIFVFAGFRPGVKLPAVWRC